TTRPTRAPSGSPPFGISCFMITGLMRMDAVISIEGGNEWHLDTTTDIEVKGD
ncbi:14897_t:CDS:2, partial [Acaulospora morrowiae]